MFERRLPQLPSDAIFVTLGTHLALAFVLTLAQFPSRTDDIAIAFRLRFDITMLCTSHPPSMTHRMHLSSRPYNFTRCFSHRIFRLLFTSGPLVTYVLLLPQSFSHHIHVSPMFCIVLICFTSHSALCFFTRYGDFPRDVVSCHETWLNAF